MDGDVIRAWLAAIDSISYYELFRLPADATPDDIRGAFHAFAEAFHPDVHRDRDPESRDALGTVFKRGTEAYRILADPDLRMRYDEALAQGDLRPESLIFAEPSRRPSAVPASAGTARLLDQVRSPGARPFVARAIELLKKGDPQQAKLQLVMARHMESNNPALEAFAKELDEAAHLKAEQAKKSWQK